MFLIRIGLDNFVMKAVEGEFEPIADAQFVINFAQVVLDNLLGGTQLEGNLFVAFSLRNAGDDCQFLGRKARLGCGVTRAAACAR